MMKNEFIYLTMLRGFAALWVGVHHAFLSLEKLDIKSLNFFKMFIMKGWLAVDLFFILSGFILAHSYQDKMKTFNFHSSKNFIINRIARIFPAHLFVMLIFGLLILVINYSGINFKAASDYTLKNYLSQVFLLHGIGIIEPRGWNIATWSISSELLAYLTFPLIIILFSKWIIRARFNLIIILLTMTTTVTLGWILNGGKKFMLDHEFSAVRILSEFVIGICLCQLYRKLNKSYIYLPLLLLAISGIFIQTLIVKDSFYDFVYLFYFMAIILFLGLLPQSRNRMPLLSFFGEISYSFYLIHSLVIIGLNQFIRKISFLQSSPFISLTIFLVISVLASWFIYEKVEKTGKKIITSSLRGLSFLFISDNLSNFLPAAAYAPL